MRTARMTTATPTRRHHRHRTTRHPHDEHRRRLILLLNKLTPTTSIELVSQFVAFVNESTHEYVQRDSNSSTQQPLPLRDMLEIVVKRSAEDGPRFVQMYAELCRRLTIDLVVPPSHPPAASVLAEICRETLASEIGSMATSTNTSTTRTDENPIVVRFHPNNGQDEGDEAIENDEAYLEYEQILAKQSYCGHLRLCAELYKCSVFDNDTITEFVESLCRLAGLNITTTATSNTSAALQGPTNAIQEARLEALCTLLETTGWKLEIPPLSTNLERMEFWLALEDCVRLGNAQDDLELHSRLSCTRLRFMVMDLLDLRSQGWRRVGPLQQRKLLVAKTLTQIHDEVNRSAATTSASCCFQQQLGQQQQQQQQSTCDGGTRGRKKSTVRFCTN